jgi:predicted lipoprotein with Yx(FWY)xxD motif
VLKMFSLASWRRSVFIAALLLAFATSAAIASEGGSIRGAASYDVNVTQNAMLGKPILTDWKGMTLYIRTSDPAGGSSCTGGCATTWPPLQPLNGTPSAGPNASGTLAVFTRSDGTQQVTYNGMALYHYSNDQNPGDANGDGVAGVWHAATP